MPEWVYLLAIFVALSCGYAGGFVAGSWRSDRAPNALVWESVRKHAMSMNKECALREMELNHEEQMAMIERGVFDQIRGEEEEDEEDDD